MIELTLGAQQRLESYFAELRRVLVDDGKADPGDVERDIRDHIQTALADAGGPVDESRLDQVLRCLGAPAEWIDSPDRPWFAKPPKAWLNSAKQSVTEKVHRFAAGPESYRLPYLSLMTLVVGLMLSLLSRGGAQGMPIFFVATLGAFVLARAALSIQPEQGPTKAQLWLMSPALLMVYIPLLVTLVAWPLVPGGVLMDQSYMIPQMELNMLDIDKHNVIEHQAARKSGHIPLRSLTDRKFRGRITVLGTLPAQEYDQIIDFLDDNIRDQQARQKDFWTVFRVPAALVSVWWVILAGASWAMSRTLQAVFAPFSPRFVRRSLLGIAALCVLISLGFIIAGGAAAFS